MNNDIRFHIHDRANMNRKIDHTMHTSYFVFIRIQIPVYMTDDININMDIHVHMNIDLIIGHTTNVECG